MKKRGLSLLLAILMVVTVFSPAFPFFGIKASALGTNSYEVELAFNNLFVFDDWARNDLSTTIMSANGPGTGGTIDIDVTNGSFTLTKTDAGLVEIYTAYCIDTTNALNNSNYYTIDVEPNTTYTFSYVLENTTYTGFIPFVFYFDENNLAITETAGSSNPLMSSSAAKNLNGANSWSFTTPADADHIQIRFTVNGEAVTGTVKDIIICEEELLTGENVFNFNEWAGNSNSSILASGYALGNGTHSIDQSSGRITFNATGSIFTNFILDNCSSYYTMDVAPNTTYAVSYNFFNSTLVNSGVAIAWHRADGSFIEYTNLYATNSNGYNNHYIVTPHDAAYMQIAFGAFHSGAAGVGTIGNIKVYDAGSVFSLRDWAANANNNKTESGIAGLSVSGANNAVTFTTSTSGTAHFTSYSAAVANKGSYYVANVEPNTTYTFNYNVAISGAPSGAYFEPWFIEYDAAGNNAVPTYYYSKTGSSFGENQYTLTTGPNSTSLLIVFSFHHTWGGTEEATWTISNLALCPQKTFEEVTGTPHRETYTYTYNGDNAQYGDLPVANAPEGYVFSGWFTGENGTGERITPETYVKMESFSVFAYYEPKVDALELVTAPNKTTYTVGEKLNTTGLSLKATQNYTVDVTDENGNVTGTENRTRTFYINSNIYCSPEYLTTSGTQTITAHYGGKTVTFPVTVLTANSTDIVFNGEVLSGVSETNGKYTFNKSVSEFNRYKITYVTDSYVRGIITYESGITEEFFLEPGDNQVFVSFVDDFIYTDYNGTRTYDDDVTATTTHNYVASIEFTCLNNELGSFQLKAVATELKEEIPEIEYFDNAKYRLGVDILYGGVVSELYDKSDKTVTARVYNTTFDDGQGNVTDKTMTLVDYAEQLDERDNGLTATGEESTAVNLINTLDRGRYLQQSYYGTDEDPYVQGRFNDSPWKYNPVQGGNVAEEASKVIDYEVTDTYIYVKARPLEWEKWSDDHVDICNHYVLTATGTELAHTEKLYGNDVVSDTYVEAWYYFDDGMIKVRNRKVDYSGLPEATSQQELPALYLIEPLNHFVYNDVEEGSEWSQDFDGLGSFNSGSLKNIEEPEFWGIVNSYNEYHYVTKDSSGNIISVENDSNGDNFYDLYVTSNENWAAFTASEDPDSFGVGIYSPGVTQMYFGVMPQIYGSSYDKYGNVLGNSDNLQYRHAETVNPTVEMPTSYIAPLREETFRSFEATEYVYYLKTGTAEEIYEGFSTINDKEAQEELAKTKIAVPETGYLNPANNTSGQYYVNNLLDEDNYYNVVTEADSDNTNMYFGIHVDDGVSFSATVTNVTDPSNDIILGNGNGTGNREGEIIYFDSGLIDSYISTQSSDGGFSLRLTNSITPGSTVTAKWEITVTLSSGATETHTVYTVLYAPGLTVGAVAEGRQVDNSQNEIASWITGANGVDHSQQSPLGSFHGDSSASGYFKEDPLVLGYNTLPTIAGSGETANDYINVATDSSGYYVMQTATNGHDDSRSQSYLGLLTVDGSRYTNTNQIPNLRIGYDALRKGDWTKDSIHTFNTYYALGTVDSFTSTDLSAVPSGSEWVEYSYTTNLAESNSIPYRETVVPSYDVSEIDGQYIHAITRAQCIQDYTVYVVRRYSTAGTSLLCSVTDKSALRDAVLEGYNKIDADAEYLEKLEDAATVLGDPSASQDEIDKAREELADASVNVYALKYDNIFSALEFSQHAPNMTVAGSRGTVSYNNGTITVTNAALTDANEAYTNYGSTDNYYLVAVKPNTEYVFEYDVTSTGKSQAFMFFYNASGSNSDIPNDMLLQTNGGAWTSKTESNAWWGNTDRATGKYAIKFTTGADTVVAGFRFGNSGSEATTSTFSNIKLVESSKYYADVTYTSTETAHKENTAYGTLQTIERPGYTFNGWKDANGNTVTGANLATDDLSIYSQWTENSYTIIFNANGGTGSIANKTVTYTQNVALPTGGVTNYTNNLALKGWATTPGATEPDYQLGQTVSKLTGEPDGTVTLYAVWYAPGKINVTFDNLVDISKWSTSVGNGTLVNPTDTGFTVKSNEDAGEATCSSDYFTIEAGHKYVVEADVKGDGWDIYIFFCDANGNWVDFTDSGNRLASSGHNVSEVNGIHYTSVEFTAPAGAVKAQLRVDANGSSNTVSYDNIRVYDTNNTTYLETVNKYVEYGDAYGELPVPVKAGSQFLGWVDENGNTVTAESIMDSITTVYLTSTWTVNAYTANDDTVVIEYGSPVKINVLANDKSGTVSGIGTAGVSGSNIGGTSYPTSKLTDKANALTLGSGSVTLNADGTITFTPSNTNVSEEIVFYYELTVNSAYYYAKVTVIPATSIYFEDTFFDYADSSVTKNGTTYNYNWQNLGTSVGEVFQSTDRPGSFNFYDDDNNVYGYDPMSDSQVSYSGGTVHYVEVDQNAGTSAPTATFTFTGTGFDLFSVTDSKTGTVTATIYSGTAVDSSKRVMGVMSNTYFGYGYDSENDSYFATDNGALLQVPVVRTRDLSYGTYTVVIQHRYNKAFDAAGTGVSGVYVDSVRIYDPMGDDNATANDAYLADGEYAPQYLEIRDTLVASNKDGSFTVTDLGLGKSVFLDGGKTSMDDFANLGPKNEVYLQNGNSIAFHIVTDRAYLPSTVQLGMKLTGKNGSLATVNLTNGVYYKNITLDSTTERYYNIEAVVDWVQQTDGTYKTSEPIVVTNMSDAIISLTSVKWAFDSAENPATVLSLMSDMDTPVLAKAAVMTLYDPEINPQQTILSKDNISYEFAGEPYAVGDSGTLTITTEQGVAGVTVNGTAILDSVTNGDGKLEWTFEFTADTAGSVTFDIVAHNDEGIMSETVYATTTVEENITGDGAGDTTEPDDDVSADTGFDSIIVDSSFATNLVNKILALIMEMFELLLGGVIA